MSSQGFVGWYVTQIISLHTSDPKQFTTLYASTVLRSAGVYSLGFLLTDSDKIFHLLFSRCFDSVQTVPRAVRVEWISRMLSNVNCVWMMQGIVQEFVRYKICLPIFIF